MLYSFSFVLELLARSGGGGSSSGGGGGAAGVIALLGYFPSYYLGKLIKKLLPRTAELIVSAVFASIISLTLIIISFAAGVNGVLLAVCIVIGIWGGWAAAFFDLWTMLQKRAKAAKAVVDEAAKTDGVWNSDQLLAHAQKLFLQYQADWSTFNLQNITTYTTPQYARHSGALLAVLRELQRTNNMADTQILQSLIIDAHDETDNTKDTYVVAFNAMANDQLIDTQGTVLFESKAPFTEYWKFARDETTWRLDSITQATQDLATANQSVRDFAVANNMYYSLDMGWLLLPTRGHLMARGRLGMSDINNHVVGYYSERLVQLYTFTPMPRRGRSGDNISWLVVQITLPKSYGGILIQRDGTFFNATGNYLKPAKGYTKYEFEWPDFNQRYDVHATDADRLATFELLNPGFMAYLYDNDPGIGIEVADNVLYLFKNLGVRTTTTVDSASYTTMMAIALKAFKELRL